MRKKKGRAPRRLASSAERWKGRNIGCWRKSGGTSVVEKEM